MACTACLGLVFLVLLVASTKIYFEVLALVANTKQTKQADKAARPACLFLCLQL
jgi:hypothetical protein